VFSNADMVFLSPQLGVRGLIFTRAVLRRPAIRDDTAEMDRITKREASQPIREKTRFDLQEPPATGLQLIDAAAVAVVKATRSGEMHCNFLIIAARHGRDIEALARSAFARARHSASNSWEINGSGARMSVASIRSWILAGRRGAKPGFALSASPCSASR